MARLPARPKKLAIEIDSIAPKDILAITGHITNVLMRTANKFVHVADVDVDGVVQWASPARQQGGKSALSSERLSVPAPANVANFGGFCCSVLVCRVICLSCAIINHAKAYITSVST